MNLLRSALVALVLLALLACGEKKVQRADLATSDHGTADALAVTLPRGTAAQNGIKIAELQSVSSQIVIPIGSAVVVDLTDLVASASQYAAAMAQREQAVARLQATAATAARLRTLNADNRNVSDRAAQEAASAAASDEAAVHAADASVVAAETAARQRWGVTLATGFARGAPWARTLAARQTVLLETAFDDDVVPPVQIRLAAAAGRTAVGRYLTASPHTDARLQKPSHYYIATAAGLPVGLITTVSAPLSPSAGVFVPKQAVVWNGSQALVFVEDRGGRYLQHAMSAVRPVGGGYVETSLPPGTRVVVTGAQQLLSEQHKPEVQ